MKIPKNENFKKLLLIIQQILALTTLGIFTKNVLQNLIQSVSFRKNVLEKI